MPKGVEHMIQTVSISSGLCVKKSVMPKGVEHSLSGSVGAVIEPREEVRDAERR